MNEKLAKEIIFSFREVNQKAQQFLAHETNKREITTTQLLAISIVKKEPHLTLGELALRLKVSKSTTSGIVDRLVKAGFLIRKKNDNNRRTLNLELTALGQKKAEEIYAVFFEHLAPIFNKIDKKNLNEMLKVHQKLIQLLEGEGAKLCK